MLHNFAHQMFLIGSNHEQLNMPLFFITHICNKPASWPRHEIQLYNNAKPGHSKFALESKPFVKTMGDTSQEIVEVEDIALNRV